MKKVGIVGLGIMGRGIATNFLKNNYPVYVWNRTTSVTDKFKKMGAFVCKSPAEVAQNADIVFEVTANDQSSKQVWTGKNGILSGAKKDSILTVSATLSSLWIDSLIKLCKQRRVTFMDIALTGGRVGAETGSLTLLCGGTKRVLEEIRPALEAISKQIFYFGPEGHGMKYKLILNLSKLFISMGLGKLCRLQKRTIWI